MAVWRAILTLSATVLPTSGTVGVDASGFDRNHAAKHYTKTSRTHDSAAQSDTAGRYDDKRNPRSTRDTDTKTR